MRYFPAGKSLNTVEEKLTGTFRGKQHTAANKEPGLHAVLLPLPSMTQRLVELRSGRDNLAQTVS